MKGIAVDEAGLLYAAWSSGVVQFYEENNPVPSYTVLLPAQCVEILDLEATGRGDSSVCCVLVRAAWLGQTGPVLYDVRRDQKPMRFRGKLPPGSRSVACHAGARFILSKGKPSTNRQHVACLSTGGGIDLPEGVTPHDLLASDRALYLVGKAAGQKHRIWRTSRKSTFWKAGYEAHEPLVASLDPEGERIFVVSDACVVILDFLQKTETRIESPDIKDGHSVSTGGNRLYVLDAEAGCAYWYAHEWLAPRRTPERPLQELSGEGIAATQDQEATE